MIGKSLTTTLLAEPGAVHSGGIISTLRALIFLTVAQLSGLFPVISFLVHSLIVSFFLNWRFVIQSLIVQVPTLPIILFSRQSLHRDRIELNCHVPFISIMWFTVAEASSVELVVFCIYSWTWLYIYIYIYLCVQLFPLLFRIGHVLRFEASLGGWTVLD